jgi:hypothetical protein
MSPIDPEVPEADALEQAQPAVPGPGDPDTPSPLNPGTAIEVPEADALDQAREVPTDDDDWR